MQIIFSVIVLKKEKILYSLLGVLIGTVNGLLGAGGGMIAVPLLKKIGLNQADAQANAIAVIWPISVVSTMLYLISGKTQISDVLIFLPGGIAGALLGTFLLSKIPAPWLKKIFGAFMIWAGVRVWLK